MLAALRNVVKYLSTNIATIRSVGCTVRDVVPKSALAKWIVEGREGKDWSVEELSHRLIQMGVRAKPGTIRVWEAPKGRPPSQGAVDAMAILFGVKAPKDTTPDADLASAIRQQAAAIEHLATVLEQDRAGGPPWVVGLVRALGVLREGSGNGGSDGPQESVALRRDP